MRESEMVGEHNQALPRQNAWATLSLAPAVVFYVFAPIIILSRYLLVVSLLLPIIGLFLCFISLWRIERSKGALGGLKQSIVASVPNLSAFFIIYLVVPFSAPKTSHAHGSPCLNNLKQIRLVLELYAQENNGQFPPIDDIKNNSIFCGNLFPNYLNNVSIVACPSDPEYNPTTNFRLAATANHPGPRTGETHLDCITDMSYCYFGWVITNQQEAEAFFEAYDKMSPGDYDKDIVVEDGKGNDGGSVIYRFRQEMTRYPNKYGIDPAMTPLIWDKPSAELNKVSHVPAGCNVLYLDGHVKFHRFNSVDTPFPATPAFGKMLDEHPRAPIPDCDEAASSFHRRGGSK